MKNFDIVGHRKWWFCLSGLLVLIALICIIVKGFNFGIDFTCGTILDLKFAQPVTVAQVRTGLEPDGLQSSVIQLSGDTRKLLSVPAACPLKKHRPLPAISALKSERRKSTV